MNALKIINLTKSFQDGREKRVILKNINLSFEHNGLVCIIGGSGSGKSTFLNVISGLDTASEGRVLLNAKKAKNYSSFVTQNLNLLEHLRVKEYFNLFDVDINILKSAGMFSKIGNYASELSRGQRQRIALLLAINSYPSVIIADEPTSALDKNNSIKYMEKLKVISKKKLVIVVSHDTGLISDYADLIYTLKDGELRLTYKRGNFKPSKLEIRPCYKKIGIRKILRYIFQSLKFHRTRNIIITMSIFFSIITSFYLVNIRVSLIDIIESEKVSSLTINKFYLQLCDFNRKGMIINSRCMNPSESTVDSLKNSDLFKVNKNIDYIIKTIYNEERLETFSSKVDLESGRYPVNYNEVLSSSHNLGDSVHLEGKYPFSENGKNDFFSERTTFKVVGTLSSKRLKSDRWIYLDHHITKTYLDNYELMNISSHHEEKISIYDYFLKYNNTNHNYLIYVNDMSRLDEIMETYNMSFDEEEKIQIVSPTYNYYLALEELMVELNKIIYLILVFNLSVMFIFLSIVINQSINLRVHEFGVLLINNIRKNTINLILLLENLFKSLVGTSAIAVTYILFSKTINGYLNYQLLRFYPKYVVGLTLFGLFIAVSITALNLIKINKQKIVNLIRDDA